MAAEEVVPAYGAAWSGQERNKAVVRRLVDEVLTGGRLEVIDELYAPDLAAKARAWIAPFLASFPDTRMDVVALVAEDDVVVGRFACSGTHRGSWLGHPPTGRRFERVDEVSIFRFAGGRIVETWGVEDNLGRLAQLGLLRATTAIGAGEGDGEPPRSVVACSLGERALAERSRMLARDLFAHADRMEERPDGYAWRFPGDGAWHAALIEFASAERRCCSFLRIGLDFEPNRGPVWLRLSGPDGAKAFIREAFGAAVPRS